MWNSANSRSGAAFSSLGRIIGFTGRLRVSTERRAGTFLEGLQAVVQPTPDAGRSIHIRTWVTVVARMKLAPR